MPRKKETWAWKCDGDDNRHGAYHPDYEGYCTARASGFESEEEAKKAGKEHRCKFSNGKTHAYKVKLDKKTKLTLRRKDGKNVDFQEKEKIIILDHAEYLVEFETIEKPEGW
jgi:hypothetical protein